MTVTAPEQRVTAPTRAIDPADGRTARLAGVLFVLTFVAAISARILFDPVRDDAAYVVCAGADTRVFAGATMELLLIVTNIGTAAVLFSILRRRSETLALGYVTARLVECTFIAVGLLSLLAVVTLRRDAGGPDPETLVLAGRSLVAVYEWTFLLGPGFVVGIGNGLILGYLMYRSGLVPRRMAVLGLIGGPLICASGLGVMFGAFDAGGAVQGIASIPEIAWEASLGIYLIVKGFRPSSPILSSPAPA